MYTSFFGLKENPFNLTPDPRYLFLSPSHKEAFDHLLYGINERKGFIAIMGGIGTGKTTLCRAILSHLDASTESALIFGSYISDLELLQTINQEFGIEMGSGTKSKKDYIDALNAYLLHIFGRKGNAVLLIDEAQNLSHPVLEHLRMISNLETEKEKLLQIVLIGQPELKELLSSASLRQLDERITVRYDLRPLDRKDIQGYVEHRLVVGGGRGHVKFTSGAFKEIYAYSQGNPRRINAVCDRALLIGYAQGRHTISQKMVGKAIADVRGTPSVQNGVDAYPRRRVGLVAALLLLLILVAGFAGWSLKQDITDLFPHKQKIEAVIPTKPITPPVVQEKKKASLYLDEQRSLAGLFRLLNEKKGELGSGKNHLNLGLVSFRLEPIYYVMLKKAFRIHVHNLQTSETASPHYFVISRVEGNLAVAIDADGKERTVERDFILKHWGGQVSWIYPHRNKSTNLIKGIRSPEVLNVQHILSSLGYLVEPTGLYDESTFKHVLKFQEDFGLKADGIVGPQTMALLYQMSE